MAQTNAVNAVQTWSGRGRLRATTCPDGRVILRMEDGTKAGLWLELLASDVLWLIDVLRTTCPPTEAACGCSAPCCDDG